MTNAQPVADKSTAGMALYSSAWCGYCMYVRRAIAKLGLNIEIRDVNKDPQHRVDLIDATGRRTVPVLRMAGPDGREQWMPESRDIVRYLQERFG